MPVVRSSLLYSVQAWQLSAKEMQKLESVWCSLLRRMVKEVFSQDKNKKDKSIPVEEVDWSFKLSNSDIMRITKATEIKHFCEFQHLKYIAHVTRLGNETTVSFFLTHLTTAGRNCQS